MALQDTCIICFLLDRNSNGKSRRDVPEPKKVVSCRNMCDVMVGFVEVGVLNLSHICYVTGGYWSFLGGSRKRTVLQRANAQSLQRKSYVYSSTVPSFLVICYNLIVVNLRVDKRKLLES